MTGSPPAQPVESVTVAPASFEGWSDPAKVGQPYGDKVDGLLTFRGYPTRTYYGTGPVPRGTPAQKWQFPRTGGLCAKSTDSKGERVWCGSGWTGQPAVFERQGRTELWRLSATAVSPTMWNNDWDGSALVIDDYLFEGGENSQFHIIKLNRGYGPDGKVRVKPTVVFHAPGWDAQLLKDVGDQNVSIEGSVAVSGNVVYFANSGGLVQGWDISGLKQGRTPKRVFRFWTGDDTDATIVADEKGILYVGAQYERGTARSRQMGQMMKLDPSRPRDPLVWKVDDHATKPAGVWGTPALHQDIVIYDTNGGDVAGVDRASGAVRWRFHLPPTTWQSPVVVDDVLLIGDCKGDMHGYDVRDTKSAPKPLWTIHIGGCVESTPAVWKGTLYFGTRAGAFHAIGAA